MKTKQPVSGQRWKIVEKKNPLAVHGYFDSKESADRMLREEYPARVARKAWDDKTLTLDDFEVVGIMENW